MDYHNTTLVILRSIDQRLSRIEDSIASHATREDLGDLEKRVRSNERCLTRVYTVGTVISGALGWLGLKN